MALTYTTLTTMTRDYIEKKVVDNITTSSPVLEKLWSKKKTATGTNFQFPIIYGYGGTAASYAKTGQLSIAQSDTHTKGILAPVNYNVGFTLYGPDLAQNAEGDTKILDLLQETIDTSAKELSELLADDLFGTYSSSEMYGLYDAIGTSTYAGISPTDATVWTANVDSTTTELTPTLIYTAINACNYGQDKATMGVTTQALFNLIAGKIVDPKVRYIDYKASQALLSNSEVLRFGPLEVMWDRHCGSGDFMLIDGENTQIYTWPAAGGLDAPIKLKNGFQYIPWVRYPDYDKVVSHLRLYMQLVCKSRRTNYLFSAITAVSAT